MKKQSTQEDVQNLSDEERDQVPQNLDSSQHHHNHQQQSNIQAHNKFRRQSAEVNLAMFQNAIKQKTEMEKKSKINKPNFFVHGKKLRFAEKSLFIFSDKNFFRQKIVWLQEWKWFDYFITFSILCNTLTLMIQDYSFRLKGGEPDKDDWRTKVDTVAEQIFTIIFISEFLVKAIGMGFILEQGTYLRDGWNVLDFTVVISSILQYFNGINLSAMRTLRILRPLRSINSVRGMKVLVTTLIDSLPDLGNVVIFLLFVMILFAILSLQLFSGLFENRCRMTPEPVNGVWEADPAIKRLCFTDSDDNCPKDRWCGNPESKGINMNRDEMNIAEFNYGYTRFDNFFLALFSIFQALTTEGWTNIVFLLTDAYTPFIVYAYFIFLVLIGSFFVVNLILAVVNESFVSNEKKMKEKSQKEIKEEKEMQEALRKRDKKKRKTTLIKKSKKNLEELNEENNQSNHNQSLQVPTQNGGSNQQSQQQQNQNQNMEIPEITSLNQIQSPPESQGGRRRKNFKTPKNGNSKVFPQSITETQNNNNTFTPQNRQRKTPINSISNLQQQQTQTSQNEQKSEDDSNKEINPNTKDSTNQQQSQQLALGGYVNQNLLSTNPKNSQDNIDMANDEEHYIEIDDPNHPNITEEESDEDPYEGLSGCHLLRKKVEIMIETPVFIFMTTFFILANTLTLSLDKYPMNKDYEEGLELANYIFTIVFALEMLIKIFGLGPKGYVRDSFNIFDGSIVVLSLAEIVLTASNYSDVSGGGFAAISAFRSLRLFRIFKLARSWVNLRQLLVAMVQTLGQISNFTVLVLLFMTVASLLGMEFFAYKIRFSDDGNVAEDLQEGDSPRVNFDTFLQGIIAVFVLLTNEDWNAVLYSHLRGMNSWVPVIYFIIVVIIGNFILLKLFLAILIYNFGEASAETKEKLRLEAEQKQKLKRKQHKKNKQAGKIVDKFRLWKNSFLGPSNPPTDAIKAPDTTRTQPPGGEEDNNSQVNDEYVRQLSKSYNQNGQQQNANRKQVMPLQIRNNKPSNFMSPNNSPQNRSPDQYNKFFTNDTISMNTNNPNNTNNMPRPSKNQSQHLRVDSMGSSTYNNNNNQNNNFSEALNDLNPQNQQQQQQFKNDENTSMFIRQDFQHDKHMNSKQFSKYSVLKESGAISSGNITERPPLEGKSLFFLGQKNCFRLFNYHICGQNWFEWSVIGLIIFSSIMLVLDDPMEDPDSDLKDYLFRIDQVVTVLFVIESLVKIIAFGLIINGPHSYLRSLSNILDFIIVVFSVVSLFETDASNLEKLKILRILRVLRPLRLISRNEGLKLAINSLILSIPSMFNLLVVCLIFFLLFGIFGVNYFKGSFFYCDIEDMKQSQIETKIDCLDYGGNWVNKDFNFDNILEAMITLFVLATTEGWVSMMWDGVDQKGIDLNPQRDANMVWAIFYILFILVGGFFIINLFAGIVVDSFNSEKDKLAGMTLLTSEQQEWIDIQQRILDTQPEAQLEIQDKNMSFIRKYILDLTSHRHFDPFILLCIILNTLVFMLVWFRQPQMMEDSIKIVNIIFLTIFTLEAFLKIIAYKTLYFKDSWNNFDFVVVCLTLIGVILEQANVIHNIGSATSIIRTFRIARVLKLIKRAKSLRMMFATFIVTLPALANIGALLFLVLFLYSVLGMNLFNFVWQHEEGLTNKANFVGFLSSFFTLFKCSTGESWNLVLGGMVKQRAPNFPCNQINNYADFKQYGLTGCGDKIGYFYLISFQIIFAMIVLNLFVAVILEGFDKTLKNEASHLKPLEISDFVSVWKIYDPRATGFMKAIDFRNFIEKIEPPMGFLNQTSLSNTQKNIKIAHLHIPIYHLKNQEILDNKTKKTPFYFFYEVFECLAKDSMLQDYGYIEFNPESDKPIKAIQHIEKIKLKFLKKQKLYIQTEFTSSDRVCVDYIQRAINKYKIRKDIQLKQQSSMQLSQPQVQQQKSMAESKIKTRSRRSSRIQAGETNSLNSSQITDKLKQQQQFKGIEQKNNNSNNNSRNPSQLGTPQHSRQSSINSQQVTRTRTNKL